MHQLTLPNSVYWDGHVLRRQDVHVLTWAMEFEVEGQRSKQRSQRGWKGQVEEGSMKCCFGRLICTLSIKVDCWH